MIQISLDDAVTHLRELMVMSKDQLIRESKFVHDRLAANDKIKKSDIIVFAFERKFNSKAIDPTVILAVQTARIDPFNPTFMGTNPLSKREF